MRNYSISAFIVISCIIAGFLLASCATPEEYGKKTRETLTKIERSIFPYAVIEDKNRTDSDINDPRRFK